MVEAGRQSAVEDAAWVRPHGKVGLGAELIGAVVHVAFNGAWVRGVIVHSADAPRAGNEAGASAAGRSSGDSDGAPSQRDAPLLFHIVYDDGCDEWVALPSARVHIDVAVKSA